MCGFFASRHRAASEQAAPKIVMDEWWSCSAMWVTTMSYGLSQRRDNRKNR